MIRVRKLSISLVFSIQCYYAVPKSIRLNHMHYLIMTITNKQELQQIAFNHSWDIDFKDFMNIYKKCTEKPYSFIDIDATLLSDNPSRFRKNLLERIQKLVMTIDDKIMIRLWKLQYDINNEAVKISALSKTNNRIN